MNEQTTLIPPTVGQLWYEQGGIYCGMRLIEGVAHHIITAPGVEHDKKDVAFSGGEWPVLREAIEQLFAECRS